MKSIIRTATAALSAVAACVAVNQAGAQTQLAAWNVESISTNGAGGPPPAPFPATSYAANYVIAGNLSKSTNAPGIGTPTSSSDEEYGGNAWTNATFVDSESNSISNGLFILYSAQAAPGYVISFSTNFLNFHTSSTGPSQGALQYSTDGVNFSNIALIAYGGGGGTSTVTGTNIINLATNAFLQNVPSSKTNFFRLVNWGATGATGTWYIYNTVPTNAGLQLFGSVAYELAGWNVNGLPAGAGGAPPADFAATTVAANVLAGNLTKSTNTPGIQVTTTTAAYGGNGWTNATFADNEADSITNGLFIEYSAQAAPGFEISFSENFLNFHTSSTGPSQGALQYCTDGVSYSNIALIAYGGGGGTSTVTGTNLIDLSTNAFLQDVPSTVTNYFRIVNWGATGTAGTWYIYNTVPANPGLQLLGTVNSATGGAVAPANLVVTPMDVTTNAGSTVEFDVTATGSTPTFAWYQGAPGSATAVPNATNALLILPNVLAGNAGSYFVVLSNSTGSATSSVVTLAVTGDPSIVFNPNNTFGLLDGTVQFSVTAAGTAPSYTWYQYDTNDNTMTLLANGTQPSGSTVADANTSTLTIANLQAGDAGKSYVVVVSNAYGSVTSAPVQLFSVSASTATLAFWDFNGPDFTNTALNPYPNNGMGTCLLNPPPEYGAGTASAVGSCFDPGTSPFSGSVDPEDGAGTSFPQDGQAQGYNFSWGTDNYPLTGGNKENGVQFMVSTIGAKDVTISYDSRTSATASDYERLQFTTDGGNTWTDYPSSSTFGGVATTYRNFAYDLTGFADVANNPDFGFRVVTEYQSTATYGIGVDGGLPAGITNNYVGVDNAYGTGGTVTYDIVFVNGQAITHNYFPPTIGPISYINSSNQSVLIPTNGITNLDYLPLTATFTIGSSVSPLNALTVSAQSLNPTTFNPNFGFSINGSNVTMTVSPYSVADTYAAAPILVTVTDGNGDSTVEWFYLTLQSLNLPPTNTLASITSTNMLANTSLSIPFVVGAYDGTNTGLSYASSSYNNTVMPSANIVITGQDTTNPTVTFMPATNQLGIAPVSVSVDDNNPLEAKTTTADFSVMVRPNTNIVFVDYFNYDSPGSLDGVPGGVWGHLSGPSGQMQFGSDTVTVDTLNNTENLQTPLLGAPYYVNSAGSNTAPTLYASFIINMNNLAALPLSSGTYFAVFNDGSGVTGNYNCGIWISTNNAATGNYRLGIVNFPSAEGDPFTLFPQDLVPNSNYIVVTALTLSNSASTIWIDPANQSSPSVTDNTTASGIGATNFNIKDFELRESGASGGTVTLSKLKIGTSFDSVLPSLHIQPQGASVVLTWSDPTLGIQYTTDLTLPWTDLVGAAPPYTNIIGTNAATFFRFGQ